MKRTGHPKVWLWLFTSMLKQLIIAKKLMMAAKQLEAGWGSRSGSYFTETDDMIDSVRQATPDMNHISDVESLEEHRLKFVKRLPGRKVRWFADGGKVLMIDSDKIHFMEGNQWRLPQAAGYREAMEERREIEIPAARVHKITEADVEMSQRFEEAGDLEYEMSMTRPWEPSDVGDYTAQLLDGNHRAAAAMSLGETKIPVYVAENSVNDMSNDEDYL